MCKADSASPTLSILWSKVKTKRIRSSETFVQDGQVIQGSQVTVTKETWAANSELRIEDLREEDFGR